MSPRAISASAVVLHGIPPVRSRRRARWVPAAGPAAWRRFRDDRRLIGAKLLLLGLLVLAVLALEVPLQR